MGKAVLSMTLGIGILSWKSPKTLVTTLESYRLNGLLDEADEGVIYFQEIGQQDMHVANLYGINAIGDDKNIGIGKAWIQITNTLKTEYILLLENDWVLSRPTPIVKPMLQDAMRLLQNGVDVVKLRHRQNPGDPLFSSWLRGREIEDMSHLLECVHWCQFPDQKFPQFISKDGKWYKADAAHANYTNNPCLYRRQWFLDTIAPFCVGDGIRLEADIYNWWVKQSFMVAQGEGLFTHRREDR